MVELGPDLLSAEDARKETDAAIIKVINGAINKIVDAVNKEAAACKFVATITLTQAEEQVSERIVDLLNKTGYETSYKASGSNVNSIESATITIDWSQV